jgi:hypothetical protein
MPWMRRLATIAAAAEAARRYAKSNPDQAAKYLDQAAAFVDKQTKGRYTAQISGATDKVKGVAGVPRTPNPATGSPSTGSNGFAHGNPGAGYQAPQPSPATTPVPPTTPTTAPPATPPTSSNATDPTVVTPKPTPKPAPPGGHPTES